MFISLFLCLVSIFANAFAGIPGADLSHNEIGSCVVMLEKPTGCDGNDLCIPLWNSRENEAVAPVIPGYCGESPRDNKVVDGRIGMKLVDDPENGLVSVIPPRTHAWMYAPEHLVKNKYTGEMRLAPVATFTIYGRMYRGSFTSNTLVPYTRNMLHWIYDTAVRATDCAKQRYDLDSPGYRGIEFGAECNNSY